MASGSDKHTATEHQPAEHPGKMPQGQEHAPHAASQTLADHQAADHYSPPFTLTEHSASHAPHKADVAPRPEAAHEAGLPQEPAQHAAPAASAPHTSAPAASASHTPTADGTPEQPILFDAGAPEIWQARAHHAQPGLDGGAPADAAQRPGIAQSELDRTQSQSGIDNSQSSAPRVLESHGGPGSSDSQTTPAHKPTVSAEHHEGLRPEASDDAFPSKGPSAGTLPGTDFGDPHIGGTGHHAGDGTPHGHLPGTDFGGQNSGDLPETDLALGTGSDQPGTGLGMDHGFAHHADMGPPPAVA
ncbi:hypothetical protein [Streptosporangium sp. NPDC002721]|uniref:hypothetical protein n=1 Tax=Streptosporangium sp. NPDC002721 TaxID=3366188 RepID=UPI00369A1FAE